MTQDELIDFDLIPSPCYVIDERLLKKNAETLKEVSDSTGAIILCALKGYASFSTFNILKDYLGTATASSLNEARLCFEEWGKKAHVCAPVFIPDEFDELLKYSSHITFNSFSEYLKYKDQTKGSDVSLGLRINPEYSEIDIDLYNPARPESRLGIKLNELPEELPSDIEGLHFHTLCENDADVLERTLKVVEEKFGHLLHHIKWLNLGGGHHITKSGYDIDLLINLISDLQTNYKLEVILEPGEAVGWETGYLVSSVLDIFETAKIKTAMLDVSFAAHMPDCLEMPYKPMVVGAIIENDFFPTYQFGGTTCLAGDQMGNYSFMSELNIGDKIVFHDMAHYTMVKTNHFNGVKMPSIGIYDMNQQFRIVREFGYEDYKNRLG